MTAEVKTEPPFPLDRQERHARHVADRRARLVALAAERLAGWSEADLEIGCGHGHYLCAYAAALPERRSIGLDLITHRIVLAERKVEKRGLTNVAFLKADGEEFLRLAPPALQFPRVLVLFNDPWPKARHHKHRLLQPAFLDLLAERCPPGAELCFRSDHREYAEWSRQRVAEHARWQLDPAAPWPFEATSWFQDLLADDGYVSWVARRR